MTSRAKMPTLNQGSQINGSSCAMAMQSNPPTSNNNSTTSEADHHMASKGFGTRAIHVGQDPDQWAMRQVTPPISLTTTYKQLEPGVAVGHAYSRAGNPTRDVLEKCLASLEAGRYCRVFASGMSTVSCLNDYLTVGSHVLCADDVYGGVKGFFTNVAVARLGREVDFVDMTDLAALSSALKPNTRMVWLETPSNPLLKVVDIAAVVQLVKAHNKDVVVVVDNTFLTPYFQKPLTLGADAVVHSITKYINGHTDVTMGAVMTNDDALDKHLVYMQRVTGAVPSPFEVYLANRGVKTLHLRMERHMRNGLAVAEWLERHPRVERVNYPLLASHPQHKIHMRQASGMSGMLSFYIRGADADATKRFLQLLRAFTMATSLGGVESLADMPKYMSHGMSQGKNQTLPFHPPAITDNLIRLSVGVEDVEDLIGDLAQAFEAMGN